MQIPRWVQVVAAVRAIPRAQVIAAEVFDQGHSHGPQLVCEQRRDEARDPRLAGRLQAGPDPPGLRGRALGLELALVDVGEYELAGGERAGGDLAERRQDRKSTRLNSSHTVISY